MIIRVQADKFRTAFNAALAGASRSPLQPLLNHVLCTAVGGSVVLEGTDQQRGVRVVVPGVEVHEEGATVLHGRVVGGFLGGAGGGLLQIKGRANNLKIEAEGVGGCQPPVFDPGQFPTHNPTERAVLAAEIGYEDLRTAVKRSSFAATDELIDSERSDARGVLLQVSPDKLRIAGMRQQLASVVKAPILPHGTGATMLPASTLALILKSLPKDDGPVKIAFIRSTTDGQACAAVVFSTPRVTLWTAALNVSLPPVQKILPGPDARPVCVLTDAGPLLAANELALITTSVEHPRAIFRFSADGGVVKTYSPDLGSSEVPFSITGYSGEPFEVPFFAQSVDQIAKGLGREPGLRVEIHHQAYYRLIFRYGDAESGGVAVLMQMA